MNQIGLRIMKMMVDRNLTVKEVARRMEVSSAFVSALRRGRKRFTPAMLDKMLTALEAPPGERWNMHRQAAMSAGWRIDSKANGL